MKKVYGPLAVAFLALLIIPNYSHATVFGPVLLEDFSTKRLNAEGDDLFTFYNNGSGDNESASVSNGMFSNTGGGQDFYWHFFPYPYVWPTGFTAGYVKSGTFDPNTNRMYFKMMCNVNYQRFSDGSDNLNIGTYVKPHADSTYNNQGQHYYHKLDTNIYANKWMVVEINSHPDHQVGVSGNPGNDPEWNKPTMGGKVHYFDGLTRFYFGNTGPGTTLANGGTCWFDDFYFDTVNGEPDQYVASMTYQYTGSLYEVSWTSGSPGSSITYNVHYSTGSMKTAGFASGTDGGAVQSRGDDYIGVYWQSPKMSESASGMYVAIQPQGQTSFTEVYIPNFSTNTPPPPSTKIGDLNNDNKVDIFDYNILIGNFGKTGTGIAGDIDANGKVDIFDYNALVGNFGK